MNRVYVSYLITGFNLDVFINKAKRANIELNNLKKLSNKRLKVSIKQDQTKKFFAICNEMCYNVQKLKFSGLFYPIYFLIKNLSLVAGLAIFLAFSITFDNYLLKIDYYGTGTAVKNQVESLLNQKNVKRFTRFSNIDLNKLSSEILSNNSKLSYVNCKKQGNTLKIELVLSKVDGSTLSGNAEALISDCEGVVEDLKVYRGTACVKVGDNVKAGQTLVTNQVTIKDQTTTVNVLASVSILVKGQYQYTSIIDNQESLAIVLAKEKLFFEAEIVDISVTKQQNGENFTYNVDVCTRRWITVG